MDVDGTVLNPGGGTGKQEEEKAAERARVGMVKLCRMYYNGEQYDRINETRAQALKLGSVQELPEHEKLHAYSTQLQEAVDFIAAQMADGFDLTMKDKPTQQLILKALKRSPNLRGGYGENDLSLTNVVRDALIAMDTPVHIRWDAVEGTAWPEFWDSEEVHFVYNDRDKYRLDLVRTTQSVWAYDSSGAPMRKNEITEWYLGGLECVKKVYFENEEEDAKIEALGIPFIPWTTIRATMKQSRAMRGESLITPQACRHADRYNAIEQVAFLIARYNSHGNLAVIGDGATLKAQVDERINKDVADVMTFPGGTALEVLKLPTDAQMIVHQRTVLIDALFGVFGLARVDQETLTGLGQVTGYALEILNRKTDGTFAQIKNQYIGDFKRMLNMLLDMHAYKVGEAEWFEQRFGTDDDEEPIELQELGELTEALFKRMDDIDPESVFPPEKRVFEIHFGSGYIVDKLALRADYDSGLISRREYLRQSGYTEPEIRTIEAELEKEKPPVPETGLGAGAVAAGAAAVAQAANPTGKRGLGAPSDLPKPKSS